MALVAGCQLRSTAAAGEASQPAPTSISAQASPTSGGAVAPSRAGEGQSGAAKPDAASSSSKPNASKPATGKSGAGAAAERERIARSATWAPGQLEAHFEKHGAEGSAQSAMEYDFSARDAIRVGAEFAYQDRESNARRRGFYDRAGNRFTGVTNDGRRITTSFRPDRGEAYVRNLERSTYR